MFEKGADVNRYSCSAWRCGPTDRSRRCRGEFKCARRVYDTRELERERESSSRQHANSTSSLSTSTSLEYLQTHLAAILM